MLDERASNAPLPEEVVELLAHVPGFAAARVDADGSTSVWTHGLATLEPATPVAPGTLFRLFSGTKLYTATAMMALVQRGKLDLDESVTRYLPELELAHPITLRQLASHASGLRPTLKAFLSVHFPGDPAPDTAQALARYRVDNGSEPGRGVAYRNVNYAILGEVIARVAGSPFEELVAREVFEPLGVDLAFRYPSRGLEHAATGYLPRLSPMRLALRFLLPEVSKRLYGKPARGLVALAPYSLDTAAIGGIVGAVGEYLPLLREMLDPGDGLLTAASKREMLTLHARGPAGIVSREGVGLGWKLGRAAGTEFWNHEGGGAGFCSETRLYPEDGVGIVLLMNLTQSAKLSRIAHEVCERLRR